MNQEFWINLPVKNVHKAKEFFTKLGFSYNPGMSDGDNFACILVGANEIPVMLFKESLFKEITKSTPTNKKSPEVLMSFDAENEAEVDEIAERVKAAGGNVYAEPATIQGWMY